jgi:hypothetical protein
MSEGRSGVRSFSAKRPERVRALILYGSYSCMAGGSWDDVDRDPAELRSGVTSVDPELDEKYWPSTEQVARIQQLGCAVGVGLTHRRTSSLEAGSSNELMYRCIDNLSRHVQTSLTR